MSSCENLSSKPKNGFYTINSNEFKKGETHQARKGKTRVTSYELLVQIQKFRVQIHKLRVQIHELRVQIDELED